MRNSFKKISVLLLTLILVIGTTGFPDIAEAKVKVGVPQMKKWYKSYDSLKSPNPVGNGVQYTLKWKKVKGASGYQVQKYSRRLFDGTMREKWYKYPTASQKNVLRQCNFHMLASNSRRECAHIKLLKESEYMESGLKRLKRGWYFDGDKYF